MSGFRLNCDKDMIQRNGMTLVELLVVLAILALMTTVAVTSSDVFMSQGRYEATTRTLTDIQEAVLGPPNSRQADGTLISTGLRGRHGPLAHSVPASTRPSRLSELWLLPSGVAPFSLIQSANDTDVVVPCGWRGPYLRLGVGQTSLRDGWGNPLNLFSDLAGDAAAVGNPILVVSSSGAGSSASSPYNAPWQSISRRPRSSSAETCTCLDSNGNPTNPTSCGSGLDVRS